MLQLQESILISRCSPTPSSSVKHLYTKDNTTYSYEYDTELNEYMTVGVCHTTESITTISLNYKFLD